jgi:antitoxin component YwqK of YwqJK toxin-antitoxin module
MAEGNYESDIKVGPWRFYHKNGKLKQEGSYNDQGKPEGEWYWYYDDGSLLREEYYYLGLLDGLMVEYSRDGQEIAKGEFIEGFQDGEWFYIIGDSRIEGSFLDGRRDGLWKYWQLSGSGKEDVLRFRGRFIEDNPHGEHTYYWDNGNRKDEGEYVMGLKNGDWISYDYLGVPEIIITYENGKEVKYDGIKIASAND